MGAHSRTFQHHQFGYKPLFAYTFVIGFPFESLSIGSIMFRHLVYGYGRGDGRGMVALNMLYNPQFVIIPPPIRFAP